MKKKHPPDHRSNLMIIKLKKVPSKNLLLLIKAIPKGKELSTLECIITTCYYYYYLLQ